MTHNDPASKDGIVCCPRPGQIFMRTPSAMHDSKFNFIIPDIYLAHTCSSRNKLTLADPFNAFPQQDTKYGIDAAE